MTAKTLYAYTLQPVPYEVSEAEQRNAQLLIWRSTNKISTKIWAIMGVIFSPCDFRSYLYQELFYSDLLGCHCLCSTLLPWP